MLKYTTFLTLNVEEPVFHFKAFKVFEEDQIFIFSIGPILILFQIVFFNSF